MYPTLFWFQINVNHNVLVTNRHLFQMKIRNDALCTFCKLNCKTITNRLWKCEPTKQFIKEVMEWLKPHGTRFLKKFSYLVDRMSNHFCKQLSLLFSMQNTLYMYLVVNRDH